MKKRVVSLFLCLTMADIEVEYYGSFLDNYKLLFSGQNNYFNWYKNSLLITGVQLVFALFLSACVGYGFAMYDFKFKNLIFGCVLLVMKYPRIFWMPPVWMAAPNMEYSGELCSRL